MSPVSALCRSAQRPSSPQRIVETLVGRREMLLEYFSFEISETGDVKTIPHLLREYTPNLDKLPMFLMRLGPQVCFGAMIPLH